MGVINGEITCFSSKTLIFTVSSCLDWSNRTNKYIGNIWKLAIIQLKSEKKEFWWLCCFLLTFECLIVWIGLVWYSCNNKLSFWGLTCIQVSVGKCIIGLNEGNIVVINGKLSLEEFSEVAYTPINISINSTRNKTQYITQLILVLNTLRKCWNIILF
jgi:hypothetical protein